MHKQLEGATKKKVFVSRADWMLRCQKNDALEKLQLHVQKRYIWLVVSIIFYVHPYFGEDIHFD